jgi:hypothetical protein
MTLKPFTKDKALGLAGLLLACLNAAPVAALAADDAARLKADLTPLGAERAGNKDGSIPAWGGGLTGGTSADKPGGRRTDPFKDDKIQYSVSGKNMDAHGDKLTDGVKALLKKYPDFRLDVYPTRRTAAAPQWVYDQTARNLSRAKLEGDVPEGAYGGIPFPIPKTGAEVMWNHLLRWRGTAWQMQFSQYQITVDGKAVLTAESTADQLMPYYLQDGSPDKFAKSQDYWLLRLLTQAPAIRSGEAVVARNNIQNGKDQAWVYLPGQRRVRKLPNPCCDAPAPSTAGLMSFDEIETWSGRVDRFDWKLVGKREMLVPYNVNRLFQPKADADVLGSHFIKPEAMRWELHRVWVVEASLRAGQRHQAPKSRYYCDEDSWSCVLGDRWDANGQLWKTLWSAPFAAPDLPGVVIGSFGFNDLVSGTAFIGNLYNGKATQYPIKPVYSDGVFTPDAMAGEGVR